MKKMSGKRVYALSHADHWKIEYWQHDYDVKTPESMVADLVHLSNFEQVYYLVVDQEVLILASTSPCTVPCGRLRCVIIHRLTTSTPRQGIGSRFIEALRVASHQQHLCLMFQDPLTEAGVKFIQKLGALQCDRTGNYVLCRETIKDALRLP